MFLQCRSPSYSYIHLNYISAIPFHFVVRLQLTADTDSIYEHFFQHLLPDLFLPTCVLQCAPCQSINEIFKEGYIPGFKRNDWQLIMMKNYNLSFGNYVCTNDSVGMLVLISDF